jgi:hypothetical protein
MRFRIVDPLFITISAGIFDELASCRITGPELEAIGKPTADPLCPSVRHADGDPLFVQANIYVPACIQCTDRPAESVTGVVHVPQFFPI